MMVYKQELYYLYLTSDYFLKYRLTSKTIPSLPTFEGLMLVILTIIVHPRIVAGSTPQFYNFSPMP